MEEGVQQTSTGSPEYVTLKWSNQALHVLNQLRVLMGSGGLLQHDVMISCDGGTVKSNKILLALCSQYFAEVFTENNVDLKTIILLPKTPVSTFRYVHQYMLDGKVTLPRDELKSFYTVGHELKVGGLTGVLMKSNMSESFNASARGAMMTTTACSNLPTSTPLRVGTIMENSSKADSEGNETPITLSYLLGHTGRVRQKNKSIKRRRLNSPDVESDLDNADKPINSNPKDTDDDDSLNDDAVSSRDADENVSESKKVDRVEAEDGVTDNKVKENEGGLERITTTDTELHSACKDNTDASSPEVKAQEREEKEMDVNNSSHHHSEENDEVASVVELSDDSDFIEESKKGIATKSEQKSNSPIKSRPKIRKVGLGKPKSGKKIDEDEDYVQPSTSKRIGRRKRSGSIEYKGKLYTVEESKQKTIKCPDCRKPMKLYNLRFHQSKSCKTGKKTQSEQQFDCNFEDCEFVGSNLEEINKHMKSHEISYRCSVCNQVFIEKKSMELHQSTCLGSLIPDNSKDQQSQDRDLEKTLQD